VPISSAAPVTRSVSDDFAQRRIGQRAQNVFDRAPVRSSTCIWIEQRLAVLIRP
jgi:hypothetical protein